ncbi:low-temperature-induced 65 kDa protein isoform X2 [Amaranthus tricolor]|uniref:low-temperature-induced 65 kDa protein isoform X2 n=1 Tax=Amaranthus tricolor TaxID=29722 RepID=UPI00258A6A29|nr:low-temperature-induced 65 kDa protein isoform X2 [Amaranthus tricolor]
MNNQMERPKDHSHIAYGDEHHSHLHDHDVGLRHDMHGEGHHDEHHGEKKSVLKKVKAKAKKIKESIKEHVGHGHEVNEDDEDDEMDTDPEIHGQEGIAKHHELRMGDRTTGERATVVGKPGSYHTFNPTTATANTPEQVATMDRLRIDALRPKGSEEQPFAPMNTPIVTNMLLGGGHSTGALEVGKKGPPAKFGAVIEKPTGVEIDPRVVEEERHPDNYQAKVANPTAAAGFGSTAAESLMPELHRSKMGERTATEGPTHVSVCKPQGDYQTFDPSTAKYVPGQEETLGWSRTDPGRQNLNKADEQFDGSKNAPTSGYSAGLSSGFEAERDPRSTGMRNLNRSEENFNAARNAPTVQYSDSGGVHSAGVKAERDARKLEGFLGNPGFLEKDPNGPRGAGDKIHPGNYESKVTDPTGKGGEEIRDSAILHQFDRMNIDDGSQQNARIGQDEIIFKPHHSACISTGSHDQFSPEPVTSKTNTFVDTPGFGFQLGSRSPGTERLHDESGQKQGSYTDKISSAATMMAKKAKEATSSATSKLGYGGTETEPGGYGSVSATIAEKAMQAKDVVASKLGYDRSHKGHQSTEGSYGDGMSNVNALVSDKAVQAKDALAYGGTQVGQLVQEGISKGGLVAGTVKDNIVVGCGKVADAGFTMASKVHGSVEQGSGVGHETGSTGADKGVSVKEYLVEKLKPGEEDRLLSEVITEALPLHKRKEDVGKGYEEREGRRVVVIKGRVTESDEVARQFGRSEETSYDNAGPGLASPGKGVMDRIYEATSSWFQKSGDQSENDAAKAGNEASLGTERDK